MTGLQTIALLSNEPSNKASAQTFVDDSVRPLPHSAGSSGGLARLLAKFEALGAVAHVEQPALQGDPLPSPETETSSLPPQGSRGVLTSTRRSRALLNCALSTPSDSSSGCPDPSAPESLSSGSKIAPLSDASSPRKRAPVQGRENGPDRQGTSVVAERRKLFENQYRQGQSSSGSVPPTMNPDPSSPKENVPPSPKKKKHHRPATPPFSLSGSGLLSLAATSSAIAVPQPSTLHGGDNCVYEYLHCPEPEPKTPRSPIKSPQFKPVTDSKRSPPERGRKSPVPSASRLPVPPTEPTGRALTPPPSRPSPNKGSPWGINLKPSRSGKNMGSLHRILDKALESQTVPSRRAARLETIWDTKAAPRSPPTYEELYPQAASPYRLGKTAGQPSHETARPRRALKPSLATQKSRVSNLQERFDPPLSNSSSMPLLQPRRTNMSPPGDPLSRMSPVLPAFETTRRFDTTKSPRNSLSPRPDLSRGQKFYMPSKLPASASGPATLSHRPQGLRNTIDMFETMNGRAGDKPTSPTPSSRYTIPDGFINDEWGRRDGQQQVAAGKTRRPPPAQSQARSPPARSLRVKSPTAAGRRFHIPEFSLRRSRRFTGTRDGVSLGTGVRASRYNFNVDGEADASIQRDVTAAAEAVKPAPLSKHRRSSGYRILSRRRESRSSGPLVANAACGLEQPRPIRAGEMRRLASLCKGKVVSWKVRSQTD